MFIRKIAAALALITATVAAHAADKEPSFADRVKVSVGLVSHQERYDEYLESGQHFMSESTDMTGLMFGVNFAMTEAWSLEASTVAAQGKATYTGATWGHDYGSLKLAGHKRQLSESQFIVKFAPESLGGLTRLGAGFGNRQLVDNLQHYGTIGYRRTNDMNYVALSIERTFNFDEGRVLTPMLTVKRSVKAEQTSEMKAPLGTVTNKQHGVTGIEFALQFKANSIVTLTPYLARWRAGESDTVTIPSSISSGASTSVSEPRNKTTEFGVRAMFTF